MLIINIFTLTLSVILSFTGFSVTHAVFANASYSAGYLVTQTFVPADCSTNIYKSVNTYFGNCEYDPIQKMWSISLLNIANCFAVDGAKISYYSDPKCNNRVSINYLTLTSTLMNCGTNSLGYNVKSICSKTVVSNVIIPSIKLVEFNNQDCSTTLLPSITTYVTSDYCLKGFLIAEQYISSPLSFPKTSISYVNYNSLSNCNNLYNGNTIRTYNVNKCNPNIPSSNNASIFVTYQVVSNYTSPNYSLNILLILIMTIVTFSSLYSV